MHLPPTQARSVIAVLGVVLVLAMAVGLLSGPMVLSWPDWQAFAAGGSQSDLILWHLRLPRVLLAAIVGAALALSGAATQGLFRNPLADPSIIGVTSGASLGASLMIAAGALMGWWQHTPGPGALAVGAFIGGLAASFLVFRLAHTSGGTSVLSMLLVGVAISALAGAANSGLAYVVDNEALRRMSLWQMGGLSATLWSDVAWAVLLMSPLMLYLPRCASALNALLLGESDARHLGIDVERLKLRLIILVAITVAAAVALTGVIAFVGLVVPHALRLLLGPDHRRLLPAVGFAGAALLVLADALARLVVSPAELPVGILTALLGAPLFLSLLRERRWYLPV